MKKVVTLTAALVLTSICSTFPTEAVHAADNLKTYVVSNETCPDLRELSQKWTLSGNCFNQDAVLGKECENSLTTIWEYLPECTLTAPGNTLGNIPAIPTCPPAAPTSTPIAPTSTPVVPTSTPAAPTSTPVAPESTPSVPEQLPSDSENVELTFAEQVVSLVNEERAKEHLSPLTIDENIEAAAQIRAKEIQSSFSHTRPNGSSFSTALTEAGASYRSAGENIAWGQKSPEEVVSAWMNSSGHRANIMNPYYSRIGVGHLQNSSGTSYWVQLFAN